MLAGCGPHFKMRSDNTPKFGQLRRLLAWWIVTKITGPKGQWGLWLAEELCASQRLMWFHLEFKSARLNGALDWGQVINNSKSLVIKAEHALSTCWWNAHLTLRGQSFIKIYSINYVTNRKKCNQSYTIRAVVLAPSNTLMFIQVWTVKYDIFFQWNGWNIELILVHFIN